MSTSVNTIRHCAMCGQSREFQYRQGERKKECRCATCGTLLAEAQTSSLKVVVPFAGGNATEAVIVDMMPETKEGKDDN